MSEKRSEIFFSARCSNTLTQDKYTGNGMIFWDGKRHPVIFTLDFPNLFDIILFNVSRADDYSFSAANSFSEEAI